MKKILLVSAFFLSSCISYDQEFLNLNLSATEKYSDFGRNKVIDLEVLDKRVEEDYLGNKNFGQKMVDIKSDRNLADVIFKKVEEDLELNQYLVVNSEFDLADQTLRIEIIDFAYQSNRKFFIGNSNLNILFKVTLTDEISHSSHSVMKGLDIKKNHFISPKIVTDEIIITDALQVLLGEVMELVVN